MTYSSLFIVFCVVLYSFFDVILVVGRSISAEDALLRKLLHEDTYDLARRPPGYPDEDGPCIVEVDLVLNSVGPVSNLDMELTTSFYLRQEWTDPRLAYNQTNGVNKTINVSSRYLEKFWLPDLFFTNGKKSYRHDITTPNLLVRLYPDGTVLYSQRVTSTIQCLMDLAVFPHDRQKCHNPMMSYGYTTDDLIFQWSSKRNPTTQLPTAFLAEFELTKLTVNDCTETFAIGTYTCLEAILILDRQIGYYLTSTYVPSILIVMLSWAAFWIDYEAVPARISVGLLTVLTITTQSSGARAALPRVSYIKAIDVWMSINLVFVFAAYMEYAVVTVVARRYNHMIKAKEEKDRKYTESLSPDNGNLSGHTSPLSHSNGIYPSVSSNDTKGNCIPETSSTHNSRQNKRNKELHEKMIYNKNWGRRADFHSRYMFPLAYIIFNIGYWVGYLNTS